MSNYKTRPITETEYQEIISLIKNGCKGLRPNEKVALALILECSLGLRISDILRLKLSNFNNGMIEIKEKKTNKLQYRKVSTELYNYILQYCIQNNIKSTDFIIQTTDRNIQRVLKIATEKLGLQNVSTHSFRKTFANEIYNSSNHNIYLLKELLNHCSVAITERYLSVSQDKINEASENISSKFLV